jgi:hypothetical protein
MASKTSIFSSKVRPGCESRRDRLHNCKFPEPSKLPDDTAAAPQGFYYASPDENVSPWPLCENLLAKPCQCSALREETTENSNQRACLAGSITFPTHCTEYRVE